MGNEICCGERKPSTSEPSPEGVNKNLMMAIKESNMDGNPEYAKYESAFNNKKLSELCQLIPSKSPIALNSERINGWVASPKTIGSLAACSIAVLLRGFDEAKNELDEDMRDLVIESQGLEYAIELIQDPTPDRYQNGIDLLETLAQSKRVAIKLVELDCMPKLIEFLDKEPIELCVRSMEILYYIYSLSQVQKEQFCSYPNSVQKLVDLLEKAAGHKEDSERLTLELLFDIEELFIIRGARENGEDIILLNLLNEVKRTTFAEVLDKIETKASSTVKNLISEVRQILNNDEVYSVASSYREE